MKKKLIALIVCLAMLAIAMIGGTMAYFTDKDEKTNVFAVGDINIELNEVSEVQDKDGNKIDGRATVTDTGVEYTNLMPTNKIVKQPTIVNTGSNAAYVRVTVDVNNADKLNQAIDVIYEDLYKDLSKEEMVAKVQAVYNEVFDGWGINYNPRPGVHGNDGRGVIDDPAQMKYYDANKVIDVDFTKTCEFNNNNHHIFGLGNMFKNDAEANAVANGKFEVYPTGDDFDGYYTNGMDDMEIRYTYYLKLEKGESFTLFDGLNVPNDFDNNRKVGDQVIHQMDFFDGLSIEIKADAIQVEGFDNARKAFEALEAAHPMK